MGDLVERNMRGWTAQFERQSALLEEVREVLASVAAQRTIAESLTGPEDSEWLRATVERRIELMGERRRRHDQNIERARAIVAKLEEGDGHERG